MKRSHVLAFFLALLVGKTVDAQEKYGELIVNAPQELPDSTSMEERAVLLIVTEVPNLQFESTLAIFKQEQRSRNEWRLLVEPDGQILTFRAPDCQPVQTERMFFAAQRTYRLTVSRAKPLTGALLIKTKPEGANLYVNGALLDVKTPYRLDGVLPGRYYVQVAMDGHHSIEKELAVESNEVTEWEIELTQNAVRVQFEIEKNLQEVSILIDGAEKGLAPGAIYLEPGLYKLMLKKQGYQNFEQVIAVPPDSAEMRLLLKLESPKNPLVQIADATAVFGKIVLIAGAVVSVIAIVVLVQTY